MIPQQQLIKSAKKALRNSYSPYSKFRVGAAIATFDGEIITGCNVENVSFGLSICAERVALFKAISEGYQKFEAIAVVSNKRECIYPCGACRQVLSEFDPDIKVYVYGDKKTYNLRELLPYSFGTIN